jgi:hypothetical protein
MPWIKLATDHLVSPQMISVDPTARWLYVVGLAWSNEQTTDGWIDEASMKIVIAQAGATKKHLAQLVNSKLIRSESRAYFIENWEIHNLSKEDQEDTRAKNRAKQKVWRDQQKRLSNEERSGSTVTGLLTGLVTTPRTDPTRTDPFVDEKTYDSCSFVRGRGTTDDSHHSIYADAAKAAAAHIELPKNVKSEARWRHAAAKGILADKLDEMKAWHEQHPDADATDLAIGAGLV